ncbi:MAG TPA: hypothetical protein DIU15_11270, partial [Deltaproteobacteria bacterium]|nr:hypothetical protein [Deltaproteobacteria bacterium]HCP46618.1 hypothetical protein [Deltaproteobacteria bacterium]
MGRLLEVLRLWGVCLLICALVGCVVRTRSDDDDDGGPRIEGQRAGDCSDAADNDSDGLFDCDDDGCAGSS